MKRKEASLVRHRVHFLLKARYQIACNRTVLELSDDFPYDGGMCGGRNKLGP